MSVKFNQPQVDDLNLSQNTLETESSESVRETLRRLDIEQRTLLGQMQAAARDSSSDSQKIGAFAVKQGRALQRFVMFDVAAADPAVSMSDSDLCAVISTANDFVRFGMALKTGRFEGMTHD